MTNQLEVPFSRVSVVGLGYIGLPAAAILASRKMNVVGVDVNPQIVEQVNQGLIQTVEPYLESLVRDVVAQNLLKATQQAEPAQAFLIAVPTPFKEAHEADLKYIESASQSIAPVLKRGDLVVLESTSPVGATELMVEWMAALRPDLTFPKNENDLADVFIAHCPERVLPGKILDELVKNDRIIGGITPRCAERARQLYKIFVEGECFITNARTAELCKLAENSFRDVNIAFANELSMICDHLNIDVWDLIFLANHHPRVNILQPGPGVGGHCIAVDPWFIVSQAPNEARLIRTAREVNNFKPKWVLEKLHRTVSHFLKNNPSKTEKDVSITCFGLTFKADIEDCRESPSLAIVEDIVTSHPGPIIVVEPHISSLPLSLLGKAELKEACEAIKETDIALILVNHTIFEPVFNQIKDDEYIIDTRGVFNAHRKDKS